MLLVDNMVLLIANAMVFVIVVFLLPKLKIYNISVYLQSKEKIFVVSLIVCIVITLSYVINFKIFERLDIKRYVLLFLSIALICILIVQIGNLKLKANQMRIELKMHGLYAKSFESLIIDIRLRQHEFDNHINTIYSQHLLCDTYESLVKVQKDYCKELEKENRYNKLLRYDNPVIRGFLYVKFLEAEKLGIEVSYKVVIDNLAIQMPVYKLVEILGDLINNAIEAMMETEDEKKLHVSIIEVEDKVEIEVRNTSRYISNKERTRFFEKGYSRKGENRGLGLYNVKKICEEYGFEIICDNKIIDDSNWVVFIIHN